MLEPYNNKSIGMNVFQLPTLIPSGELNVPLGNNCEHELINPLEFKEQRVT
jgi:hypothetical protein